MSSYSTWGTWHVRVWNQINKSRKCKATIALIVAPHLHDPFFRDNLRNFHLCVTRKVVMDWDLWSLWCILQTWLRRPVFGQEPLLLSEPRNYGEGSSRTLLTTQCKFPEYSTSVPVSWIYEDHFLTRPVLNSISKKYPAFNVYDIYVTYIYNLWHLYECTTCWRIDIFWIFPFHLGHRTYSICGTST